VNDILVHVGTVLENMKKGTSYNNKTYFEFKLPIAVININHMISNYINIHRIISQIVIVNDKLLDIMTISVIQLYS
jgi:hypothetical protein